MPRRERKPRPTAANVDTQSAKRVRREVPLFTVSDVASALQGFQVTTSAEGDPCRARPDKQPRGGCIKQWFGHPNAPRWRRLVAAQPEHAFYDLRQVTPKATKSNSKRTACPAANAYAAMGCPRVDNIIKEASAAPPAATVIIASSH